MTTKTISGTYSGGYLLNSSFNAVSITSTGSVGGFGLITQATTTVDNAGAIDASNGADGLFLQGGGGVFNVSGGMILGGFGDAAAQQGGAGQAGGAAIRALAQVFISNNGTIDGGYGGLGGPAEPGGTAGAGGAGGAGVYCKATATLINYGALSGGFGGRSGSDNGANEGAAGAGGAGVVLEAGGTIDAFGGISGGAGAECRAAPKSAYGRAGAGGAGVVLEGGRTVIDATGGITGGDGGAAYGYNYGGNGGDGVRLDQGGYLDLQAGQVTGGAGGQGGHAQYGIAGGAGGDGVDLTAGGKVEIGALAVVSGGGYGAYGRYSGSGVYLGAFGTVVNAGAVAGFFNGTAIDLRRGGAVLNSGELTGFVEFDDGGTVYNLGYIRSNTLRAEGVITNNEPSVIKGLINVLSAGGTVNNAGTIETNILGGSIYLQQGGRVTNSGKIYGFVALANGGSVNNSGYIESVDLVNGGTLNNTGTIDGAGGNSNGVLINGEKSSTTAMIGTVYIVDSGATLTNFGTISGALIFYAPGDTLTVEAGCSFMGTPYGGGGTLVLGAGTGTLSGIDASGDLTVVGFMGAASNTLFQDFFTLEIASGGSFATPSNATISSGKTLIDNGVLTIGGNLFDNGALTDGGTLTVTGSIGGAGTLTVNGKLTLQTGSALTVGTVYVQAKAAKVTIASNIVEAGLWDQTGGTLTISARKTFELTGGTDYLTGKTTTNRGNLEYAGTGQLFIQNKLVNDSQLIVQSGQITLEAACTVSGAGDAVIKGGTLAADGVFNQNVFFQGAGTLQLGRSQSYTAQVVGFTTTGTDFLDLGDIGFVSAGEATFSGTSGGGVLTVSDGTHTAHVNLAGNFLTSTFVCASDGHGGVVIHDPTAEASAPPAPHALIAAMSTLGSGSASAVTQVAEMWRGPPASLISPRVALA